MKFDEPRILSTLIALLLLLIPRAGLNAAPVLFNPELNLSEEYTDNIFLTSDNQEHDYITTTDLNLDLQIPGRTTGMTLTFNPSYNAFANHDDFNFWRYAGNLHFWNDFAQNTRLELINDYLETENPLDQSAANNTPDTPLQGPAIETDPTRRHRNRYRTDVSQGRFSHQFGARDNFYAAMAYTFHEEVNPPEQEQVDDFTILNPSLGVEYWFAPSWSISLDGDYSNRDYKDRVDRKEYTGSLRLLHAFNHFFNGFAAYSHTALSYDQNSNDYQLYEPSLGLSYAFRDTTRVTASVGYYVQDFTQQGEKKDGWNVNSEIYKHWQVESAYTNLTATSGYAIRDTGAQDLGLDIYYQARLELGYTFSSRMSAYLFGRYRYDEYRNQEPERLDRTVTAGAGLNTQLFRWMEASLNYTYAEVHSDIETQEYAENSIMLTLTLHPAIPYRLIP